MTNLIPCWVMLGAIAVTVAVFGPVLSQVQRRRWAKLSTLDAEVGK